MSTNMPLPANDDQLDRELLARYQAGDNEAFGILYDKYFEIMLSYVNNKIYGTALTRAWGVDLVQSMFVGVKEHLDSGKEIRSFAAFLYRSTVNIFRDQLRQHKRENMPTTTDVGEFQLCDVIDPCRTIKGEYRDSEARRSWLNDGINRLKPREARLIRWRYLEQLSPGEIARREGSTEIAVNTAISRAKDKLRDILCRIEMPDTYVI